MYYDRGRHKDPVCPKVGEAWEGHSGRATYSHDRGGHYIAYWSLLVCLDEQSSHQLGAASPRWYLHRMGNPHGFLARVELHHRCLYVVCQLSYCSKYGDPFVGRWW